LASASPRRRQLLDEYGYAALVIPTQVAECDAPWLSARELVALNAGLKSAALWAPHPRAVVLGVDTLVCLDGEALGKPASLEHAAAMLARLAGRSHQVFSGVCLALPAAGRTVQFIEETTVTFHPLSAAQIAAYLRLIDPLDKAGGYAAQEHGDKIIAATDGSWTNVLGLPMERLASVLASEFDIRPLRENERDERR
jgi:septum formation protein